MDFSEQLFANFSGYCIFCGFSGGADSTAALLLARKYQTQFGYELRAVHFNHHLRREESDQEAKNAEIFARDLNIPFTCIDLDIPSGENLESTARAARLKAWKELLDPGRKCAVLLGHHADDRRENLLIRLCRGSNAGGLSSMRAVSELEGITFIRPLLAMSRKDIEAFLHAQGVMLWAKDSSNREEKYLRNYLRNTLLPGLEEKFPGALKGFDRSLAALECDADFITSYTSSLPDEKKKSLSFWQSQHDAVKMRLLRELTGVIPNGELLLRINCELARPQSSELRKIPVNAGLYITLRNDTIGVAAETSISAESALWEWRKNPEICIGKHLFTVSNVEKLINCSPACAFFDGDLLPDILEIGEEVPGERMIPFGGSTPQKLKKLRNDRHIYSDGKFPLLRGKGSVYWAVNVRNSALAAVTENTKNIVKFEYKGLER